MIYSRVYRKFYPFQYDIDTAALSEKDRELLIKCLRRFPRHLTACLIEALHDAKPKNLDNFQLGSDLDKFKKSCFSVADKIVAGQVLSEKETATVNFALCGSKYNSIINLLVSPRSHIMRLYSECNRCVKNNSEGLEEKKPISQDTEKCVAALTQELLEKQYLPSEEVIEFLDDWQRNL